MQAIRHCVCFKTVKSGVKDIVCVSLPVAVVSYQGDVKTLYE